MQFWWEGAALCWQWIEWLGIFCKNRFTWFFILAIHFLKTPKTDATGLKYCWYPAPPIISLGRRWFPPCPWLVPSPSTHLPPRPALPPTTMTTAPHPPTPTEQIYILFLTSCFQGGRSQWQWLVIWICLLCLKFLSNLISPPPFQLLICCWLYVVSLLPPPMVAGALQWKALLFTPSPSHLSLSPHTSTQKI